MFKFIRRIFLLISILSFLTPFYLVMKMVDRHYIVPDYLEGESMFDKDAFMREKMGDFLFGMAVGSKQLSLSEEEVNQLIHETVKRNASLEHSFQFNGDTHTIRCDYIFLNFGEDHLTMNVIVGLDNYYYSTIRLKFLLDVDERYVFTFEELSITDLKLKKEVLRRVVHLIGEAYLPDLNEKSFGEVDLETLSISVEREAVNQMVASFLGTDILFLEQLTINEDQLLFVFTFNTEYEEIIMFEEALHTVRGVLMSDALKEDIKSIEGVKGSRFEKEFDALILKLEESSIEELDEIDAVLLIDSYFELGQVEKSSIVESIIDSVDEETVDRLNELFQQYLIKENEDS